jgi:hypothetical protein
VLVRGNCGAWRLAGFQDEENEAQDVGLAEVGEQLAGVSGAGSGSSMAAIRKPALVKALIIAGSGRCQKRIGTLWPPKVHSSVRS